MVNFIDRGNRWKHSLARGVIDLSYKGQEGTDCGRSSDARRKTPLGGSHGGPSCDSDRRDAIPERPLGVLESVGCVQSSAWKGLCFGQTPKKVFPRTPFPKKMERNWNLTLVIIFSG
ncbi:hypothetical protein SETIT_J030700v2 [Setaria italica]|uniref:Uncharacterized protein n=1 Tax=Setaria italica TaxID=4555 RepID=A0A368PF14_SETIT|nr:hypothetical protein SETIT_J030700v2 [Setaria italica]